MTTTEEAPGISPPSTSDRAAGRRAEWEPRVRAAGPVVGWVLFGLAIANEVRWIVFTTASSLRTSMPDDAYYYLETARHVARGEGVTFDGINATSGVHPLWLTMLVPLARMFSDGDMLLRATLLLGLALTTVALVLLVRAAAPVIGKGTALAGIVVAVHVPTAFNQWVNGMEGAVVLLVLAILANALRWLFDDPTLRRSLVVGALAGVLVWARLDYVLVLVIVPIAVALCTRSFRFGLASFGSAVAVGAVPFAWLLATGRSLETTSARAKMAIVSQIAADSWGGRATFGYFQWVYKSLGNTLGTEFAISNVTPLTDRLRRVHLIIDRVLWLLVAVGAVSGVFRWRASLRTLRTPGGLALLTVGILVAAKGVVDFAALPKYAETWYSGPWRLAVLFSMGAIGWRGVCAVARIALPLGAIACCAFALVAIPNSTTTKITPPISAPWSIQNDRAADQVLAGEPLGRYGSNDTGLLGYRLDGHATMVNLDGLVNTDDFARLAASGAPLLERTRAAGVDVLVTVLTDDELRDLHCGEALWQSDPIPIGRGARPRDLGRVRIVDLRHCTPT